ncbi:MAG: ferrous iron transporter B [Ruminococcaceae bacterium]|nr:ferrous iron transporter B [Oscillospiraceae bacterium]
MGIKIALAGNPNSGKTTLFNALTGMNQFVGNWPGVTVEKKEGKLKKHEDVIVTDLPGIYSLSPYTLEEIVARNYLIDESPSVILNIVDGTNIERNLYLTTQLIELGIPVVVAINMMDVLRKKGEKINTVALSERLGCRVVEISALKSKGIEEAAEASIEASSDEGRAPYAKFDKRVEGAIEKISALLGDTNLNKRWYAVKLFERDSRVIESHSLPSETLDEIEKIIAKTELELDDDAEGIIANERYNYITSALGDCYEKKVAGHNTVSDKIDRIVTNKWLALPIFALVMFLVYFISVTTIGTWATDWANDGLFGDGWHLFGIGAGEYESALETNPDASPSDYGVWVDGIPVLVEKGLDAINCNDFLKGLILDGIIGGVGAVLGFVPQMVVLFILLAFLEACGYMARIAFVMDKICRKFGLSGKSIIPMLIGTGCGVPGIMASRTIENERDRKMTVITTTFVPCSAKLPIIALIAGSLFGGAWWVAPSAYFIGFGAIVVSGIILKKTKMFKGEASPFIMELPAYHLPTVSNVFRSVWERAWSFIKKAGTVILLSSIVLWFLMSFGVENGSFGMVENMDNSVLALIGGLIAWIFAPLGWGHWQGAVATITGLIAKENVVGTFGVVLAGLGEVAEDGAEYWSLMGNYFTPAGAYSFLVFNLLCAPCFAAIGAIRREMNSPKWTAFAIGYQCGFAYLVALIVYWFASLLAGDLFGTVSVTASIFGLISATVALGAIVYLLVRPNGFSIIDKIKAKSKK